MLPTKTLRSRTLKSWFLRILRCNAMLTVWFERKITSFHCEFSFLGYLHHHADSGAASRLPMADIVFLGAGPVGLWCAVQTKILVPAAEIVMVEKYKTYQRSHVLKLAKSSFNHCVQVRPESTQFRFYNGKLSFFVQHAFTSRHFLRERFFNRRLGAFDWLLFHWFYCTESRF